MPLIRFHGAYARDNKGNVTEHVDEIIGTHLYEVIYGYVDEFTGQMCADDFVTVQAHDDAAARAVADHVIRNIRCNTEIEYIATRVAMW